MLPVTRWVMLGATAIAGYACTFHLVNRFPPYQDSPKRWIVPLVATVAACAVTWALSFHWPL